jgi:predicted metallopeptidase
MLQGESPLQKKCVILHHTLLGYFGRYSDGLRAGRHGVNSWQKQKKKKSLLCCWDPPSILSNGYRGLFRECKLAGT